MINSSRQLAAPRQAGMALAVALIVLVAMTLAGIAMMRSVDTSVMIAGNMAFRQGAAVAGDAGVEAARTWLLGNTAALINDSPGDGYYANSQLEQLDLTGNQTPGDTADDVAWDGVGVSQPKCLAKDAAGNTVCYITHRLCTESGAAISSSKCSVKLESRGGSSLGAKRQMETDKPGGWSEVATQAYYRITVRIAGPRNNIAFVQAFLLI
jgi:Tfp pilus assembly protein PilX